MMNAPRAGTLKVNMTGEHRCRSASFAIAITLSAMCQAEGALAQSDGWATRTVHRGGGEKDIADLAYCVVRGNPTQAQALLMTEPGSEQEADAVLLLFGVDPHKIDQAKKWHDWRGLENGTFCGGRIRVPAGAMRRAVAQELYLRVYSTPPSGLSDTSGPTTRSTDPYAVASCAAQRDAADADAVVRAARRSPDEQEAVMRLKPALIACSSGPVNFNGAAIHGQLAEGLYRMRQGAANERLN